MKNPIIPFASLALICHLLCSCGIQNNMGYVNLSDYSMTYFSPSEFDKIPIGALLSIELDYGYFRKGEFMGLEEQEIDGRNMVFMKWNKYKKNSIKYTLVDDIVEVTLINKENISGMRSEKVVDLGFILINFFSIML